MSKVMHIVFTGRLSETKKQLQSEVENYGHVWQSKVDWRTDLVVVGHRDQSHIDRGSGKESQKERDGKVHNCKIVRVTTIEDMIEYFV